MIELLVLMVIVALITGAGKWATQQRIKRMYDEKYKDCGGGCCEHENKGKK
jgi:hypothetical protein